jgi:hypothetical protein
VQRVLVVWCPDLQAQQQKGREQQRGRQERAFDRVMAAVGSFSPGVEAPAPGVCVAGTRGPSRYFGGDDRYARLVAEAVGSVEGVAPVTPVTAERTERTVTPRAGVRAGVGVADGLFAAVLAARCQETEPTVVAVGGTPGFLAPWPVTTLDRPELADLLGRLGIHTLGLFAALPDRDVLARFGVDGVTCHRVAQGIEGELPGFGRSRRPGGPQEIRNRKAGPRTRQPEFWGGEAGAAVRAGRALVRVQQLLGPEAVVRGRLQGGRGPSERARIVPWSVGRAPGNRVPEHGGRGRPPLSGAGDAPWPGQVPPPAPVVVLVRPLPVELVDSDGRSIGVGAGGTVTATPARLSVAGGPWTTVAGWAGPWPTEERWWSAPRRQARMQVVTGPGTAHLLTRERGGWWLEGTYD